MYPAMRLEMFWFLKQQWLDFDRHGLPEALDCRNQNLSSKSSFSAWPGPKHGGVRTPKSWVSDPQQTKHFKSHAGVK